MFETGQGTLTEEARQRIGVVAAVLVEYRATSVVIHGHTDSSGPAEVNLTLSRQRAEAVARVLIGHGIDRSRLLVVGHGATLPRADNGSPEGQTANRRVELVLRPVVREAEG
jgi:outer membrane protein OmpA-like peptidoglycan-associated protein